MSSHSGTPPCLLILAIMASTATAQVNEVKDFCMRDTLRIECQLESEVIIIHDAKYGRMRPGGCITSEYGSLGCSSDVTSFVEGTCSGRQKCEAGVRKLMDVAQPCPRDLMVYLEVKYSCVPVATGTPDMCHREKADNFIKLSPPEDGMGYIASFITQEIGYGSAGCPWLIHVNSGQRINITLLDFNNADHSLSEQPASSDHYGCPLGVVFEENGKTTQEDLCVGGPRARQLHITQGSSTMVHFVSHTTMSRKFRFILQYQAIGCEDLSIPATAWMKRTDNNAQVQCNLTGEIWYLTCRDGRWIGDVGDCDEETLSERSSSSFPFGLMLAVIIGIVLGVVVGVTLLGVVFLCRRGVRKQNREHNAANKRPQLDDLYSEATLPRAPPYPKLAKPMDPRPMSAADYGYKHDTAGIHRNSAIDSRIAGDCDSLKKPSLHILQESAGRNNVFVPSRAHMYESPKFARGQCVGKDVPPVYHELDAEHDEGIERYTT